MSRIAMLVCTVLLLSATGCYRTNVVYNAAAATGDPTVARYSHHLIVGLANLSGQMDVSSACPNGVAKVQTKYNGVSWLATVFTGYIYTPMRVRVWCNPAAGVATMDEHESDLRTDDTLRGLVREAVEDGRTHIEDGELIVSMQ